MRTIPTKGRNGTPYLQPWMYLASIKISQCLVWNVRLRSPSVLLCLVKKTSFYVFIFCQHSLETFLGFFNCFCRRNNIEPNDRAGKPNWWERFCTDDLLGITSLNQLLFYVENIIYLFYKTTLMRRSNVLILPNKDSLYRAQRHSILWIKLWQSSGFQLLSWVSLC